MKINNIISKVAVALGVTATIAMTSCSDNDCPNYWDDYYGPYKFKEKPRYIWVDAAANFPFLANDQDKIAEYLYQAKRSGFTDIVVDVRPTNGDVLFKTDLVDQVKTLYTWLDGVYGGHDRDATWDYLQAFIDAGHAIDLRIHAAMNTMVGGHRNSLGAEVGMVFRDASKRDWVTTLNIPDKMYDIPGFEDWVETPGGLLNMLDISWVTGEMFLNPHNPDVQDFIVGLVGDLATNYPELDGIILDRGRFMDYRSDFSDLTKQKFEEFIGEPVANWPDDVMPFKATAVPTGNYPQYYKKWWEFRAKAMHDIVEKASAKAHANHPGIQFGCYVGAWYNSYYQSGVNWASPNYDPVHEKSYEAWANNGYKDTGYADHVDIIILGCYAKPNTVYGTTEWTCQGFASRGYEKIMGSCPLVIGGPDIGNNWPTARYNYVFTDDKYAGWTEQQFLDAAKNTVDACINACDGYFMFDICHLQGSPKYWDAIKAGIDYYYDYNGVERPYEEKETK